MAVLLNILKIIGIVLLVILIVLLVLLLLVLFAPIVYRAKGEKQEQIRLKARISWLFPLIYGKIHYDEEKEQKFSCIFYLLGIPVYDALAEKKPKEQKEKKANKEKSQKKQTGKKKTDGEKQENTTEAKKVLSEQTSINTDENTEDLNHWEDLEKLEEQPEELNVFARFIQKIKKFFIKIKLFFEKLFEKIKNIKYTVLNVKEKLENIQKTVCWYIEVLNREESKRAISKCKTQLSKFFKHIKPQKIKGNVIFGFEDPATTGEVLAYISMFYPIYGNHINIVPVFNENILKGDFYVKGRIRVFTVLKIGWSILFDKEVRKLYNILTGGMKNE
ncbi:MAG: DUF2953 domain-containing protein [Lachnospiraceae bacterium]|nr:DUF2953 domain-containing protein [Lachnospiraceae bacterium]